MYTVYVIQYYTTIQNDYNFVLQKWTTVRITYRYNKLYMNYDEVKDFQGYYVERPAKALDYYYYYLSVIYLLFFFKF